MISFKAIKPAKLKVDAFRLESLNAMRKDGRKQIKDYQATTKTWSGDKPSWQMQISLSGVGPNMTVFGTGPGVDKWNYLDRGTKVRYATMSADFQAKTTPRVLGSRAGKGKLLVVRKSVPRPGIEAREWTPEMVKKWTPLFAESQQEALDRAAKKSGHSL